MTQGIRPVYKSQKSRLFFFFLFFGLTGMHLILQNGLGFGIYMTLLTWSFFVLCLPIPGNPILISSVLHLFTDCSRWYLQAAFWRWIFAVAINIFTFFAIPYIYLNSITSFLLYRIISNPWPYWIIILASSFKGLYEIFVVQSNTHHSMATTTLVRHQATKFFLTAIGLITFFYLSYHELIIFIFSRTC